MAYEEEAKKVQAVCDAVSDRLIELYYRWQDEREYEQISDYAEGVAGILAPLGFKVKRFYARPFGFNFDLGALEGRIFLRSSFVHWQLRPQGHPWGK